MREGYKETKIGILPKDWDVVKQGQVATFFNGRAYKLSEWETEGIPVIRLQNLTGSGKEYYYSNLQLPEHQYCYKGDLLYMWSATFGPVWWFGEKAIFHYHIWKVEHNIEKLDRCFHYYLLDDVTRRMKNESHGSTMMHVTKGGMEKLLIQLPPLPEQQKIAEILSTVDDKIEVIDQQITETQKLKKGLMQRLLTKGIGHTEFENSALGEIPKCWEVVKLEKVAKIERGKFQHRPRNDPKFYGGKYPYVQTGDIAKSTGKILKYSQSLNELGLSVSKLFPKGTIVITIAANIGDTAIAQFEIAFPDSLIGINVNEGLNNVFLRYFLVTQKNNLDKLSTVSAQKNINLETLKPYKIPIPPIKEQQKIADILTSVDEKLEVLLEKKTTYQELKKGLMQQLLTGKVRVTV